jgi:hypothetical protein
MRVLAVCLAMRAAADMAVVPPAAPQQSSVRDWWFVSPVMEAVTLSSLGGGEWHPGAGKRRIAVLV